MCERKRDEHAVYAKVAARLAAEGDLASQALDVGTGICVMSAFTTGEEVQSDGGDGVRGHLILDSWATDHVFPTREHFERYSTKVPADKTHVRTADGRAHPVFGVGLVKVSEERGVGGRAATECPSRA